MSLFCFGRGSVCIKSWTRYNFSDGGGLRFSAEPHVVRAPDALNATTHRDEWRIQWGSVTFEVTGEVRLEAELIQAFRRRLKSPRLMLKILAEIQIWFHYDNIADIVIMCKGAKMRYRALLLLPSPSSIILPTAVICIFMCWTVLSCRPWCQNTGLTTAKHRGHYNYYFCLKRRGSVRPLALYTQRSSHNGTLSALLHLNTSFLSAVKPSLISSSFPAVIQIVEGLNPFRSRFFLFYSVWSVCQRCRL